MARKLTKKQKDFANAYIDTGNGTQSALKAYDTDDYSTANAIAVENLQKPSVIEYITSKAEDAASMVYQLSQFSKQDFIKLNASKDILDRAGYKPVERSQSFNVSVSGNLSTPEAEALRNEYEQKLKQQLIA